MIIGPHRSGTSAFSGVLSMMGIFFGSNLLDPSFDNPKGFFENKSIVALNDEILNLFQNKWYTSKPLPREWWKQEAILPLQTRAIELINYEYNGLSLFAIKDPRMALLFPFWKKVLTQFFNIDIHVVIVYRKPIEIVQSLMKRNSFSLLSAIETTSLHLLSAERYSRGLPRNFVNFNNLLEKNHKELISIFEALDLDVKNLEKVVEFIDPKLSNRVNEVPDWRLEQSINLQKAYFAYQKEDEERQITLNELWIILEKQNSESSKMPPFSIFLLIKILRSSIDIISKRPFSFIANLNKKNFKTLAKAMKEENPQTIITNLKKLLML